MKIKLTALMLVGFLTFLKSQIVNIPDANFKAYLVGNPQINTNNDNQIQVSEAIAFTGTVSCNGRNIISLTGIEAFVNITSLSLTQNQVTNLDISKNTLLTYLDCSVNQLTSLDISKNLALKNLWCFNNQITNLDVTKNTNLIQLATYKNPLTTLNVTQNYALQILICYENQLTNLDVTKNLALKELYCYRNQIISLELNNNLQLTKLSCDENKLEFLDLSKNSALTDVWCDQNLIRILNLKNGQNPKIINLDATNNGNETCIIVDNVANAYSYSGWKKDVTAGYDLYCTLTVNETSKKEILMFPNPAKDILNFSEEISNIRISDLSGKVIKQISNSEKLINASKLSKGTYIITATSKSGELINKKFIKE
ncbi:T9SS type A sorting domain-containing protein [Epilithonimonas arachidiradicis]|uniref:Putative secreted protein (Por secretion system target) n=1 Tax=Epilithonimonas arachidiradicis TaxID=1617282 RepID=A0A420DCF2_9FLAO|nr:T9SS type A sorting domain-containing protein [Epilithonimonas arachidiradicis]RKE89466.1 putative secreted protein (Por secretion system target) [Epilithonimonas arachidiradicis]GGG42620.1 hypothetical protein GCM10007332_00230 [Epilithonimonas arachidiradicis]